MPTLKLSGQVRGGKNNYLVLRNGMHIPRPIFAKWSKAAIEEIQTQFKPFCGLHTIGVHLGAGFEEEEKRRANLQWTFTYTPEDRRRRDVPAILDAVFHVLERAGVVSDDAIIKNLTFTTLPPNKNNAGIIIQF